MQMYKRKTGGKLFVVGLYFADSEGVYHTQAPTSCPFVDKHACLNKYHSRRMRKIGLPIPLSIFYCQTHGRYFTVYPPGWCPWLRVQIIAYTPEGQEIPGGNDLFLAVRHAKAKQDWPETAFASSSSKSGQYPLPGVLRTQKRHVHLAAWLLGIHPDIDDFFVFL